MLEGEAGIGKTAVWLDAVGAAAEDGHLVLDARPAASDAQLAYAAFTDLVGAEFAQLREALPAPQARAVSAALLLEDHVGAVELRAVAMGFVSILAELAGARPVLVAVDDIQWLDPASERVLAFAAPRLPAGVRLLLARRQDATGKGAEHLRGLSPDVATRVVLGPLSLASLRHLIHERTGWSVPRPLLTRLATTSGGNPLYALEIARVLARRPVDPAWGEALPVPATLQELVATRVEALSGGAQEALLVASALSRPTDALVADVTEADGAAGLAEARKAEVITQERGPDPFHASAACCRRLRRRSSGSARPSPSPSGGNCHGPGRARAPPGGGEREGRRRRRVGARDRGQPRSLARRAGRCCRPVCGCCKADALGSAGRSSAPADRRSSRLECGR